MISIQGLNQYYGQSHTLWDIDLEIPEKQCTVLMGRNGVGKTTLLHCIMGLQKVSTGQILLQPAQKNLLKRSIEERPRLGIGYVPQGRQIFPLLTVAENLHIGLPLLPRKERAIPDLIFDLFPVLAEMLHRRGGDLSGGQQQQLAIARALVIKPHILILDEPTEGIQPNVVHEIGEIIRRLNRELNLTVLLVEQKLAFARKVGDRFCILDRGHKVAEGDMSTLDDALIKQYLTV